MSASLLHDFAGLRGVSLAATPKRVSRATAPRRLAHSRTCARAPHSCAVSCIPLASCRAFPRAARCAARARRRPARAGARYAGGAARAATLHRTPARPVAHRAAPAPALLVCERGRARHEHRACRRARAARERCRARHEHGAHRAARKVASARAVPSTVSPRASPRATGAKPCDRTFFPPVHSAKCRNHAIALFLRVSPGRGAETVRSNGFSSVGPR